MLISELIEILNKYRWNDMNGYSEKISIAAYIRMIKAYPSMRLQIKTPDQLREHFKKFQKEGPQKKDMCYWRTQLNNGFLWLGSFIQEETAIEQAKHIWKGESTFLLRNECGYFYITSPINHFVTGKKWEKWDYEDCVYKIKHINC